MAFFEKARITFATFDRDVLIFEIEFGGPFGPVDEVRFRRGYGYLAIAPDRSITVYALVAPPMPPMLPKATEALLCCEMTFR